MIPNSAAIVPIGPCRQKFLQALLNNLGLPGRIIVVFRVNQQHIWLPSTGNVVRIGQWLKMAIKEARADCSKNEYKHPTFEGLQ
jgi:hypothetical protein